MKNLRKWFTLVELIVVITILAILGTIAFISLQGYSSDARNSKRTSDLNSIASSLSVKATEGVGLLAFVSADVDNQVTGISIGGAAATVGTDYNAGTVNYTGLGIKQADFQDPNGTSYVIGATTKVNGKYQLAAKMEQGGGATVAKVVGDYVNRTTATSSVTVSSTGSSNTVVIDSADINKLKAGDTIGTALWNTAASTVVKVSADGLTLTLSSQATSTGELALAADESTGLIEKNDTSAAAGTSIVTDGGTNVPY